MLSVLSGHTDCVYSLLNKGASVEAKDKWGRTALHRGVRRSLCPLYPDTYHSCYVGQLFYSYTLISRGWDVSHQSIQCFNRLPTSPFSHMCYKYTTAVFSPSTDNRRWPATRSVWRPCFSTVPTSSCRIVKGAHRSTWQQHVDILGYWEACCMLPNQWKHSLS